MSVFVADFSSRMRQASSIRKSIGSEIGPPSAVAPGWNAKRPSVQARNCMTASRLAATVAVALAAWATVRFGWSRLVVLYGRRRFAVTVLTGYLLNAGAEQLLLALPAEPLGLRAIGYIVPGLIANAALSQGRWSRSG